MQGKHCSQHGGLAKINSTFSFQPIKKELVKDVINGLKSKNSSSQDGISTIILKKLEPLISESLALIINQSFYTGLFPDKLKLAKVIPIHKKNETSFVENYRPISILPAISKVFEKVALLQVFLIFKIIISYLTANMVCEKDIRQSMPY